MKALVPFAGKIRGEKNVLMSPIFEKAFEVICKKYEPSHSFAIFSLCTKTRPYSSSMKWRGIEKIFGDFCDLVVCSNAGIIPLEYEDYYPYNCYDSDGTADELSDYSKELFASRLTRFFKKFRWEKVAFLFSPYEGAADVVNNMVHFENMIQLPNEELWRKSSEDPSEFIGYSLKYYKVLSRGCVKAVGDFFSVEVPYLREYKVVRKLSLIQVIDHVYDNMEVNVPYSKNYLLREIEKYSGGYDRSYVTKILNCNVVGVPDYKYSLKNHQYFIRVGSTYYKNGSNVIKKNKLF